LAKERVHDKVLLFLSFFLFVYIKKVTKLSGRLLNQAAIRYFTKKEYNFTSYTGIIVKSNQTQDNLLHELAHCYNKPGADMQKSGLSETAGIPT
jgi:hypothetical protein